MGGSTLTFLLTLETSTLRSDAQIEAWIKLAEEQAGREKKKEPREQPVRNTKPIRAQPPNRYDLSSSKSTIHFFEAQSAIRY